MTGTGTGTGTETRAVAETGTGTRPGTGSETGKETRMEKERGEEESFGIHHIRKEAEFKNRHCHSARSIICTQE